MYKTFSTALKTTYNSRYFYNYIFTFVKQNEQHETILKTIGNDDGDYSNRFTLLGASGCGKSSSIKMMLN